MAAGFVTTWHHLHGGTITLIWDPAPSVWKLRAQYYLPIKSYYLVAPIAQDDRGYYTLLPLFYFSPFKLIISFILEELV